MLTYAFDLLYLIYEEEATRHRDTRFHPAAQSHRYRDLPPRRPTLRACTGLQGEGEIPSVLPAGVLRTAKCRRTTRVHFAEDELRQYIRALGLGDLLNQPMLTLLRQFEEAKNFGSLIQPCLGEPGIAFARCAIEEKDLGGQLFVRETHLKVLRVLEQAEVLTPRYNVVVTNPPYMGTGR